MPGHLDAGDFSIWLAALRTALINNTGTDVPCGDCAACCRSSYFIHIHPEEKSTVERIDKRLLFPAPGLPRGHKILGYDETGRCPMFVNHSCSIYEYRPLTCRQYDCRIFAATGISPGEEEKAKVKKQINRWQFSFPEKRDRDWEAALKTTVQFLQEHAKRFQEGIIPENPTRLAVLAIKVCDVFVGVGNIILSDVPEKIREITEASVLFDQNSK